MFVRAIDKILIFVAVGWFVYVLQYIPATGGRFNICNDLAEKTHLGNGVRDGFVDTCKRLLPDPDRMDLVYFLLATCVLLIISSFRLFWVSRKRTVSGDTT